MKSDYQMLKELQTDLQRALLMLGHELMRRAVREAHSKLENHLAKHT